MEQEQVNDEIERKWLLRNLPETTWDDAIYIEQHYFVYEGKPQRLRFSYDYKDGKTGALRDIEFLWKEQMGMGHNKEHRQEITVAKAMELRGFAERSLRKVRWIKKADFKYEVDEFLDLRLVMMEVEVPYLEQAIDMPGELKQQILTEVTGVRGFSNSNIAIKMTF